MISRFDEREVSHTCRHCGKEFKTRFRAKRTCDDPGCQEWSAMRKAEQIRRAWKRQKAKRLYAKLHGWEAGE